MQLKYNLNNLTKEKHMPLKKPKIAKVIVGNKKKANSKVAKKAASARKTQTEY